MRPRTTVAKYVISCCIKNKCIGKQQHNISQLKLLLFNQFIPDNDRVKNKKENTNSELKDQLENYKSGFSVLRATKYYVEALEKAIEYIENRNSPFTLSLTSNNNSLSQWRAYTDNGIGVNIGFSKEFFTKNDFKVFKCIYDSEKQKELVSHIVTESIFVFVGVSHQQGIFEESKNVELKEYDKAVTIAGNFFIERAILACSLIKDSNFVEENEWRALYFKDNFEINFINKGQFLKPFIKFKIDDLDAILNEVNIGPNQEQTLCETSIKILLQKHKVNINKVKSRNIPYRN